MRGGQNLVPTKGGRKEREVFGASVLYSLVTMATDGGLEEEKEDCI